MKYRRGTVGSSRREQFREACRAWLVRTPSRDTRANYARDLGQFLCLPFKVIREPLKWLKDEKLIQIDGGDLVGEVSYRFSLTDLGRRFTPVGYVGQLARKTVLAGNPPGFEVDRLLVLKVLGLASGLAWVPLDYILLGMHGMLALLDDPAMVRQAIGIAY